MLSIRSTQVDELSQFLTIVDKYMITSMTDIKGVIRDVSEAFCHISGYSRDELIGKPHNIVRHPDSSAEVFKDLWNTIQEGKQWQGEIKNRKKNGDYYWVITTIFARYDADNNIIGYMSLRQDITPTKQLEKQNTIIQEQSKNAAMGEMIALIAHQWLQPLSIISTLATNAEIKIELSSLTKEEISISFAKIIENVRFLSETVNDFKNFFKSDTTIQTSISEVLQYSINIITPIIKENHIHLIFNKDLVKDVQGTQIISVYKNDLAQIILNLIKNSVDALVEKKIIAPCIKINLAKEKGHFILEISDNAGGIPEHCINKVFDNDFSTKGEKGTGLGLYMSRMIVEKHLHGQIKVHNNEDGACFHVRIPVLNG